MGPGGLGVGRMQKNDRKKKDLGKNIPKAGKKTEWKYDRKIDIGNKT